MNRPFFHPRSLVESDQIGAGSRVWAFAHVMKDAVIGDDCNICDHCFVESGARIGHRVTLKNNVTVWDGVVLDDDVFVGPNVTFTNDLLPRSPRTAHVSARYQEKRHWLAATHVQQGASIGANATILPVTIGQRSMVAAGAVVTRDVSDYSLVMGNPARHVSFICVCGQRVDSAGDVCPACEVLQPRVTHP